MDESTWDLVLRSFLPLVEGAVKGTIPLALVSFVLGLAIALGIALMRLSKVRILSGIARAYVSVVRGTPLLVQLFVIFYGLPSIGVLVPPWPSAVIAFSLNVGGYAAEVIRAAILSVPRGQWEAAYTIRMPPHADPHPRDPPPGGTGIGAAALEHLHQLGQGHFPRLADPRHRALPAGTGNSGLQPGVYGPLH